MKKGQLLKSKNSKPNSLDGEVWKDVVGHEGRYSVSSLGRVYSHLGRGGIRKPGKHTGGYLQVSLCIEGKGVSRYIHRLVMEAFIGSCPEGHNVNHKNFNKEDNRLENLEYITIQENQNHWIYSNQSLTARKKWSELRKGYTHSKETKNKMIETHAKKAIAEGRIPKAARSPKPKFKDTPQYTEYLKKMSVLSKERMKNPSRKQKEHLKSIGIKLSKEVIDLQTGILYSSAKEAAEALGVNKTTFKFWVSGKVRSKTRWRYLSEL